MKFDKGPRVCIQATFSNNKLIGTRLTLSESFLCEGVNKALLDWCDQYIQGTNVPFLIPFEDCFQGKVMQKMQTIPLGKTMSYSELATVIGSPRSARAVGNACNRNPFPLLVPCHRVIRSNGQVGGFAFDIEIKKRLLDFEATFQGALGAQQNYE
jgi:methylated-DNA-[protein]-cysteine S-methyltransferase